MQIDLRNEIQITDTEIRQGYRNLTQILIDKHLTIATMESATSGQIASLITDTEGASAMYVGGFVTYCNEAKIRCGVSEECIEKYSVYSKETACEMAKCCRNYYGTDIGIGVTGTMGNIDSDNREHSVPGEVYFAICINEEMKSYQVQIPLQESRYGYKMAVAKHILDALLHILEKKDCIFA